MQDARQCPANTDTVFYETFLLENFTEILMHFNAG
jgi:hypothetical protein